MNSAVRDRQFVFMYGHNRNLVCIYCLLRRCSNGFVTVTISPSRPARASNKAGQTRADRNLENFNIAPTLGATLFNRLHRSVMLAKTPRNSDNRKNSPPRVVCGGFVVRAGRIGGKSR